MIWFSNRPVVAKQADHLLSKLLKVQSPVITSWIKKRNLNIRDEDKIIKAWRMYFSTHFVLSKYPHANKEVDVLIEQLAEDIRKLSINKKFIDRMEKLFLISKTAAIETVKKWKIRKRDQKQIIQRISKMKLYWMKSFKTSKLKSSLLDYIKWGIAYDPVPNEVNMGVEALAYPNDETYLAVFAHEMGHSFDSCRWGAFFDGNWPFQKIGHCLRSKKSVEAKRRDDSFLSRMFKRGKISSSLVAALKNNRTCNKRVYPPVGVQMDQLPESFADWFSAEVMAELKVKNRSALRMDLCEKKSLVKGSSYIPNRARLEKIYFAHPKINPVSKIFYCSM